MSKQFNRQRRHNNNNRSRSVAIQQITRFTIWDSSGPLGKLRGTALQLAEKYQAGAKDAQTQGDDVLLQTCQQYADHYLRLQAIAIENEQAKIKSEAPITETPIEENSPAEEEKIEQKPEISQPLEEKQVSPAANTVVEKRPLKHHKKNETLAMPMEALQEKSEITE